MVKNLAIIAGKGRYPILLAEAARRNNVGHLTVAACHGDADPVLEEMADACEWFKVGEIGRLLKYFKKIKVSHVIMAGQITPGRLFDLRPDLKSIIILARLKKRNAETIFGAVADELKAIGAEVLPAITFMDDSLASLGLIAGSKPKQSVWEDVNYGFELAKKISKLDIGQCVIVKEGTVLAVEAFEGTNDAMRRGGKLGKGGGVMVKVSKPNQDFRFDVPVLGTHTLDVAKESGIKVIACEAKKTLILDKEEVLRKAKKMGIVLIGCEDKTLE